MCIYTQCIQEKMNPFGRCLVRTLSDIATPRLDPKIYLKDAAESAKRWQMANGVSWDTVDKVNLPQRVTVIGGGTMGTGIASSLAVYGYDVNVVESNTQAQERCSISMHRITEKYAKKLGKSEKMNFSIGLDLDVAKNSDLVIEAVIENMDLKIKLFGHLDSICPASTIFATNTSTLDLDRIANSTNRPGRVVGMHFLTPAHINKLVEVVYGQHTTGSTVSTIFQLAYSIDKMPILVRNVWGFAANRMLGTYLQSAMMLVEHYGLTPTRVDDVMVNYGFGFGPFTIMDIIGMDVIWNINREAKRKNLPLHDKLVEHGMLGQKTGMGWHLWEGGRPTPNPEVHQLIEQHCPGITHTSLDEKSIVEYCLLPVVNSAFDVLEREIVSHEADIDLIFAIGFGWPQKSVGPMYWARHVQGLNNVLSGLQKLKESNPQVGFAETSQLLVTEAQKTPSKL